MKKGSLLIFSLGIMAIVAALVSAIGFRTYIEIKTTKNILNSQRALFLAVSGIELASQVVRDDEADFDYAGGGEAWSKGGEEEVEFLSPNKKGKITFTIYDEASRVNLNTIVDNVNYIKRLFELSGLENFEEKAEKIGHYIYGSSFGSGFSDNDIVKDYQLSLPEEVTLIKGFNSQDYKAIKDFITAYGKKINLNTASSQVLSAFIDSAELVDKILERRCDPAEVDSQQCYYTLAELKSLLGPKFKEAFDVKTSYFRVVSLGVVDDIEKKIVCVMDRAGRIVYWKE